MYTGVTIPGRYSAVVQYNDKIWFIPGASGSVGKSATGVGGTDTLTDVTAMPWGDQAFMLKDRLFIFRYSENIFYYSQVRDLDVWAGPGGGAFKVNPGDGQFINAAVVTNNIMTIFKRDATYSFSYLDNPGNDGTLRQVSYDQGAFDAITYNNEIYCVNSRSVFKFINGYFVDIGEKLDLFDEHNLDESFTGGAELSIVDRTLIVGGNFSRSDGARAYYAMNLDSNSWSQYDFPQANVAPESNSIVCRASNGGTFSIYKSSNLKFTFVQHKGTDVLDQGDSEVFWPGYKFTTKEFVFEDDEDWKRLYAWAIEAGPLLEPLPLSPAATVGLQINGVLVSTTDAPEDFLSSVSARFRRIAFIYNAHKPDGVTRCTVSGLSTQGSKAAREFYTLSAIIVTKTRVTT